MKFFPIIMVLLFWVISQVIKASRKQAQQPRGGQNTNNSGNQGQNFAEQLREFANRNNAGNAQQGRPSQGTASPAYSISDPFEDEQEYVSVTAEHFKEERLVEEYKRLHAKGETIKHHKHDYFNEQADRKKAEKHGARKSRKQALTVVQGKSPLPKAKSKKARAAESQSAPFSINKANLKQAIIQSEIIGRPEDRW